MIFFYSNIRQTLSSMISVDQTKHFTRATSEEKNHSLRYLCFGTTFFRSFTWFFCRCFVLGSSNSSSSRSGVQYFYTSFEPLPLIVAYNCGRHCSPSGQSHHYRSLSLSPLQYLYNGAKAICVWFLSVNENI